MNEEERVSQLKAEVARLSHLAYDEAFNPVWHHLDIMEKEKSEKRMERYLQRRHELVILLVICGTILSAVFIVALAALTAGIIGV